MDITRREEEELQRQLALAKERYNAAIHDKGQAHAAAGDPDMHENAAAEEAYTETLKWGGEIERISRLLAKAKVVLSSPQDVKEVRVGHKVTILFDGKTRETMIMAGPQGRRDLGQIASTSLIGKAILGKPAGWSEYIKVPDGQTHVEIVSIEID